MFFLDPVRSLAAHILAASVLELFPQSLLIGGDHDGLQFHYDFVFPFEFQKEFIPLIEEKMRQLIKEQDEVQIFEMVPSVAASFLTHHNQPERAEAVQDHPDTLATVVQLRNFTDYSPFPVETGPFFFKLDPAFSKRDSVVRISGASFKSKELLKNFLKSEDPLDLGRALDLFVQDPTAPYYGFRAASPFARSSSTGGKASTPTKVLDLFLLAGIPRPTASF